MKNFVIRYGIIGACLSILFGLSNWFIIAPTYGPKLSEFIGYLTIVISLLTIPLGIRYYRDKLNSGLVSYKEGFKIGIGITFINSMIMGIYGVLFFAIEGNNFSQWQKKWLSEEEMQLMETQMASMPEFMLTPLFQGIVMFLMVFLIGFIINILSVLTLRRT